ncbi:MAG TPA: FAD-dependent monooxygenase [Ktedonobacteraceae bacterium]|nr:FAD-dependent monooxygenase [Ktedonobacteraceae bacterium]
MDQERVPVLIIGGGIVGLSASLFLSRQGIASLLVERHQGTSIHPRARGVNGRTMELYRELGLEEAIREAGKELSPSFGIYKARTLKEVIEPLPRRTEPHAFPGTAFFDQLSPAAGNRVTQDLLEPVLLAEARRRGGDLRFYTEMVSFEQDESGVTAVLRERATGTESTVRADYMIAADGAGSRVRQQLGVEVSGRGSLGHLLNILFRADLREFVRDREFSICLIEQAEVRGLFTSINNSDRWVFHLSYDPTRGQKPEDFPPARCRELLRLALGMPEIEIEILSILPWECAARVVEGFQQGRVFLAGDAAHQMPPWGGQGANTGVQDAHNLAWKLAAVLKGQASSALLATYDSERRPVGATATEESAARAGEYGLLKMQPVAQAAMSLLNKPVLGKVMRKMGEKNIPKLLGYGYRYHSASILEDGHANRTTGDLDGTPGTRVPHAWVERQGQRLSTLDLGGGGFALLAGSEGAAWCEQARAVAASLRIELTACTIGPAGDLRDPQAGWQKSAGLSASGALLVRPDGFVAWRARQASADGQQELARVLKQVLCRPA